MSDYPPERRRDRRHRTVRAAIMTFEPTPCVLLDVSQLGARLNVNAPVPDEFTVEVDREGLKRRCRVIWRNGEEVGVEFLPEA